MQELAGTAVTGTAPEIGLDDVRVAYDGHVVLDGISLTLATGRTTVVMGPSGVGKTTLLRQILGLQRPDRGAVRLDGRRLDRMTHDELAQARLGMGVLLGGSSVYDASLFGSLSVFDNVATPLRAAGLPATEVDPRTWRALHEFGLGELAEQLPIEISAGERRRTALAKAMINDPGLLVLDDPGPALDLVNRDRVVAAIARRTRGATCVLVTHDIDLARRLGDRLVVLLDGDVVADGAAAELLDGVQGAAEFDARFGFSGRFAEGSHADLAALARRARRQGLAEARLLMGVLLLITLALMLVMNIGLLDNPMVA
jgi:ABC-type transporter Mla maintaining outer membrane lipid asymmetry ATPase subunit MlaF